MASAAAGDEPVQREIPFTGPPAGAPQAFTAARTIASRARLFKPIMREERPIGVLELAWAEPAVIDRSRLALADLLAVEVAVTLERVSLLAELEKIARTDELTGLPNRRAWQEELPRELGRAGRSGQPLCVAMLDLDHFKRYNDRRGHQTGDRLLKQVAGAWTSELRPTDLLARYGGEEFALALSVCGAGEAVAVVERMRGAMPDEQTCSAGIACWDGSETAAELLGRADQALYEAKRGGRNRSAMAAGLLSAPAVR